MSNVNSCATQEYMSSHMSDLSDMYSKTYWQVNGQLENKIRAGDMRGFFNVFIKYFLSFIPHYSCMELY